MSFTRTQDITVMSKMLLVFKDFIYQDAIHIWFVQTV